MLRLGNGPFPIPFDLLQDEDIIMVDLGRDNPG